MQAVIMLLRESQLERELLEKFEGDREEKKRKGGRGGKE